MIIKFPHIWPSHLTLLKYISDVSQNLNSVISFCQLVYSYLDISWLSPAVFFFHAYRFKREMKKMMKGELFVISLNRNMSWTGSTFKTVKGPQWNTPRSVRTAMCNLVSLIEQCNFSLRLTLRLKTTTLIV